MKICKLLIPFLLLVSLAGCNSNEKTSTISPPAQSQTSVSGKTDLSQGNPPYSSKADDQKTPLDKAIIKAVFEQNKGKYLEGESQGIGYHIFETFEENNTLSVYALIEYIEYEFQDNAFVNISGTRSKVLLEFSTDNAGYTLKRYIVLDSASGLTDEALEELMAPLKETGKDYRYTDATFEEVRQQADNCAKEYLTSIGRTAVVKERESHGSNSLLALGVHEDVCRELAKNEAIGIYPDWVGVCEKIENGIRFVYQTDYQKASNRIIYTKTRYDTDTIDEKWVFDSTTGEQVE